MMLTSGYNSKKLPKGFQGYPKLKWIFGFFGVTCNYNLLSNFLVQRLLKLSDLRIFGFVQKLDNFTVWLKFKDFWIFPLNNFFSPEIITSYRIKDFWIFSKKNFFPRYSDLWGSRIFGFFYFLKFSNFHTMEFKDFWIFSKKDFFPDFHISEDQGFLDISISWTFQTSTQWNSRIFGFFPKKIVSWIFTLVRIKDFWIFLFPEIFKLLHNEIKGFLDFFQKKIVSQIITLVKIKDFWIFFISSNFQTSTQWN